VKLSTVTFEKTSFAAAKTIVKNVVTIDVKKLAGLLEGVSPGQTNDGRRDSNNNNGVEFQILQLNATVNKDGYLTGILVIQCKKPDYERWKQLFQAKFHDITATFTPYELETPFPDEEETPPVVKNLLAVGDCNQLQPLVQEEKGAKVHLFPTYIVNEKLAFLLVEVDIKFACLGKDQAYEYAISLDYGYIVFIYTN
jgi:hypothetical protein